VEENEISRRVIGCAIDVQRTLGVGLLESAYRAALGLELTLSKVQFGQEVAVSGHYKGTSLGLCYRADFIVEQTVIVEVKALDSVLPIHRAQLLSYLRLSGLKLGLLINFHTAPLTRGICRVVNQL
jgi:GxxExxY protein